MKNLYVWYTVLNNILNKEKKIMHSLCLKFIPHQG